MKRFAVMIGHGIDTQGNWDSGCTYGGYQEAQLAKEVVAGILEVFNANGVPHITDYPDNGKNIIRCVEWANAEGVDAYISIHLDYDKAPSGIYPIYLSNEGLAMAEAIRASMKLRIPGLKDRGNLCRADHEVNATNMPAVIMEIGSIKNDLDLIRNNTKLFGHSIAYGLLDWAKIPYTPIGETGSTPVQAPVAVAPPEHENTITNSGFNWGTDNVQYFLNVCNYGAPAIDNDWGAETTACLKLAQHAYGITEDGLWGPTTQSYAEKQIMRYQTKLASLGIGVECDGVAGPGTFAAVKEFQRQKGLEIDGIIGVNTYSALFPEEGVKAAAPVVGDPEIRNFEPDEFLCEDGCGGDVKHELKVKIQKMRDLLNERSPGQERPLIITSGFRCANQNRRVNGVKDSLHMEGSAADLYTPGMTPAMMDELCYCAKAVGLGVLRYPVSKFVHVQLYMTDQTME